MSNFECFERAATSVLALRGVMRCLVITHDYDNIGANPADVLARAVLTTARDIAFELLEEGGERKTAREFDCVIVARRFEDVALVVIGDQRLDESEVLRKLNVVAIRAQVSRQSEPPGPLVVELRDAYVEMAGNLGSMVFDRAFDDLKRSRGTLDIATLREFAESLAAELTPPTNHRLRERFQEVLPSVAPSVPPASGSFQSAPPSSRSWRPASAAEPSDGLVQAPFGVATRPRSNRAPPQGA